MPDLLVPIIAILGKYVIGKGAAMLGDVGQEAVDVAKELWETAVGKLKEDPGGAVVAGGFEELPEVYEKPLIHMLEQLIAVDEALRLQLTALLNRYQEAVFAYAPVQNRDGAVAQGPRALAASGHAVLLNRVAVGGDLTVVGHGGTNISGADQKALNQLEYNRELRAVNEDWVQWQRDQIAGGNGLGSITTTAGLVSIGVTGLIFMGLAFAIGMARVLPDAVTFGPFVGSVIGALVLFFGAWTKLEAYKEEEKRHFERLRKLKEKFEGKLPVESNR